MMKRSIMVSRFAFVGLAALSASGVAAQDGNSKLLERGAMSRAKGGATATVMVYEIADFQCPFCARFVKEVFPRIDSAYIKTGKVQWFFVNLPLPAHGNAWAMAEAALCAGAVADRFWPMHDRLFATQTEWASARDLGPTIDRLARESGAAGDAFQSCIAEDRVASLILQDVIFAASTRISGTPAFVVNNEETFVGVKTFEEWIVILDAAIKKRAKE